MRKPLAWCKGTITDVTPMPGRAEVVRALRLKLAGSAASLHARAGHITQVELLSAREMMWLAASQATGAMTWVRAAGDRVGPRWPVIGTMAEQGGGRSRKEDRAS